MKSIDQVREFHRIPRLVDGRREVVAYLAHPVSAPTDDGIRANLASARAWLKWLVDNTEWAISAPWMPYVETLAEETYRPRGLRDDLAMLERHDLIILVGGRISSGMRMELDHAVASGLFPLDLTRMGASPPADHTHACTLLHELCGHMADAMEKAWAP